MRMHGPLTQEAGPGCRGRALGCQSVARGPELQTLQWVSEDTAVQCCSDNMTHGQIMQQLTSKSEQCINSDICCITGSHVWHGGGGEASQAQVTFVYTVQLTCNAVCICHGDLLLLSDAGQRHIEVGESHLTCGPRMHHLSPWPGTSSQMYRPPPGAGHRCKHQNILRQYVSSCEYIRDYKSLQSIRYSFPNDQKRNLQRLETNSIIVNIMRGANHHYHGSCKKGTQYLFYVIYCVDFPLTGLRLRVFPFQLFNFAEIYLRWPEVIDCG